jgi:hypothetical protein
MYIPKKNNFWKKILIGHQKLLWPSTRPHAKLNSLHYLNKIKYLIIIIIII